MEQLELDENNLLDQGCILILSGLKTCNMLSDLSLQYNFIEQPGAEFLLEQMPNWPRIRRLQLQGNNVSADI